MPKNPFSEDPSEWDPDVEWFEQDGKWGLKDSKGEILRPPIYDNKPVFDENGVAEAIRNGKKEWVNKFGKTFSNYEDAQKFYEWAAIERVKDDPAQMSIMSSLEKQKLDRFQK